MRIILGEKKDFFVIHNSEVAGLYMTKNISTHSLSCLQLNSAYHR